MKRFGLMAALALIVLVNVIVLAGVRYNRTGEADAVVTLTERELHLEARDKENSGVSLQLELQSVHNKWSEASPWFDRNKLVAVGFDCSLPIDAKDAPQYYKKQLSRRSYVVLEYEGQAWNDWQSVQDQQLRELAVRVAGGEERQELLDSRRKRFNREIATGSRLFAIDVGNDPAKLRTLYPDQQKFIITPAQVRLRLLTADETGKMRKPVLSGYVDEVLTATINVPRDRQGVLTSLKPEENYFYQDEDKHDVTPRYKIKLSYGRRYEPWVVAVLPP